jgi:uncharacterized RDD family membrane protein YckC
MLAVVTYAVPFVLLFVVVQVLELDHRLVGHAAWHVPYFYLVVGMDGLNARWRSHSGYELPGYHHDATGGEFFLAVFLVGCAYLLVAGLVLWRTAASFDRIVARAGREAYVGTFDTDEAVVPVGGAAPAGGSTYAPVWRRAVALVLDNLVLQATGAVVGLVAGFVTVMSRVEYDYDPASRPEAIIASYTTWGVVLVSLCSWPYYALFESSRRRATPGKAVMGIFVTDADGRRVSFLRASLRYFARLPSAAALMAGYLMALFTAKRQALHDVLAGTVVLKR